MTETNRNDRYPIWFKVYDLLHMMFRVPGYSIKRDHTEKFDALPKIDYDQLRGRICNGDLLFCGGNYIFSKTIRYLSGKSKVSHVGIVYWWNDRLMLMESVETDGVRIVPVSQYLTNYENSGKPYNGRVYLGRHTKLYIAPENENAASLTSNPQMEQMLNTAATLLNKKFSLRDTIDFFKQGITGRLRHKDNDQYLCSEFVAKCFEKININFPDDGRGFIAPEHIAMSNEVEARMEIINIKGKG